MSKGRRIWWHGLLAGAWMLCASCAAQAALTEMTRCDEIPSRIVFSGGMGDGPPPQRIEYYGARREVLPANPQEFAGHGLNHVRNCTQQPAGKRVQTMSFWLRSSGYFVPGVVNHMAIGLRANLTGFALGAPSGQERFQGRGIVVGSIPSGWSAADLCPGTLPLVQPETWGRVAGVTQLWGQATAGQNHCGPSLVDGKWYRFLLQADEQGLAYTVQDEAGRLLRRHRFTDGLTAAPDRAEILGNSGYFVAVMCADGDGSCRKVAAWQIELKDFKVGWR